MGGGGEIRTRGALRHSCFQDRCTKPLCDSSLNAIYPAVGGTGGTDGVDVTDDDISGAGVEAVTE